jgi:hypothetical protein
LERPKNSGLFPNEFLAKSTGVGTLMSSTPMARSACFPESKTLSVSLGSFEHPAELCCREELSQQSQADDFKADHCSSPVRLLVFLAG